LTCGGGVSQKEGDDKDIKWFKPSGWLANWGSFEKDYPFNMFQYDGVVFNSVSGLDEACCSFINFN
jgi:hypothetical protein